MLKKLGLAVLIVALIGMAGFSGWSADNSKVVEQTKAVRILEENVNQVTDTNNLLTKEGNKLKARIDILKKALSWTNEQAKTAELAKKILAEQIETLKTAKEKSLEQMKASELAKSQAMEYTETAKAEGKTIGLAEGEKIGYKEGYKTALEREVTLRDPTYEELREFLALDKTNLNPYIPGKYVCVDFAADLDNSAESAGFRAGYVWLVYKYIDGGKWANFINAFQTTDRSLIFIDPQSDREVKIEIGKTYRGETIKEIIIIW